MVRSCLLYSVKKAFLFLFSLFLLSAAVFYISRLAPGDPLISYYGERVERMGMQEREWAEEKLGLKDPVSVQYIRWLGNAFRGDFGISYKYKMNVIDVIKGRIGNTLLLGGLGFAWSFYLRCFWGFFVHGMKTGCPTALSAALAQLQVVFPSFGCPFC